MNPKSPFLPGRPALLVRRAVAKEDQELNDFVSQLPWPGGSRDASATNLLERSLIKARWKAWQNCSF
jgi:hypothetical protein